MKKYLTVPAIIFLLVLSGYCFVVFLLPLHISPLPSSIVFLDDKNQEIGELIYSGSIRHQEIKSEEIPDFYKQSLVYLEDRSFWENNGISFRGIARSTLHNMEVGKVIEGGTTLSSGLIRNAFWIGENRTLGKKILEFLYALRLNHIFSKDQILTGYINRVAFGSMNYGLKSASKYYFDREPRNLTKAEQIVLLIIPKDSQKYNPYQKPKSFRTRFETVTGILRDGGIITSEEYQTILLEKLSWNIEHGNPLPYVTDFLSTKIIENSGKSDIFSGTISTTFDRTLTEQIDALAKNTLTELAWRNVSDYGVIITERDRSLKIETGLNNSLLRVMIGGTNYNESTAGQVNTTLALRQPGSTIKPFTYLLAFEKLKFTPESTILDLPIAYKTSENYAYEPKNYSLSYKGEITLRQALSQSVNIPAIKLTEQIGVPTLLNFLRRLGITSLKENADHYGLGLTLGNGEVSLLELLQAYTIFANNGTYCPLQIFNSELGKCIKVADTKYIDMVVSILTDRYAKLGGFPLYSALDFSDRNVFVKTGTSRNFRDNWSVGFTDHYMIGVWTGNKNGEDMKGVSGATGAGEIFRQIVYTLEKEEQNQTPQKLSADTQSYLTITNPLTDSLYRIESTKNTDQQKIHLHFETSITYDTSYWLLDGRKLDTNFIGLTPGNHAIEIILMKNGEIIQQEKSTFRVESAL